MRYEYPSGSNNPENEESDSEWLWRKLGAINRRPTPEMEEKFCERVAIAIHDGKLSEQKARELALNEVLND